MIGYWLGSCWYWYDPILLGGMMVLNVYNLTYILRK